MLLSKPETESRFFLAHSNVMTTPTSPHANEDLMLLCLAGLAPLPKLPELLQQLEINVPSETTNKLLCERIGWAIEDDWKQLDSSYGDESDF